VHCPLATGSPGRSPPPILVLPPPRARPPHPRTFFKPSSRRRREGGRVATAASVLSSACPLCPAISAARSNGGAAGERGRPGLGLASPQRGFTVMAGRGGSAAPVDMGGSPPGATGEAATASTTGATTASASSAGAANPVETSCGAAGAATALGAGASAHASAACCAVSTNWGPEARWSDAACAPHEGPCAEKAKKMDPGTSYGRGSRCGVTFGGPRR
jgi:hypothetical protein